MTNTGNTVSLAVSPATRKSLGRASAALSELAGAYIHHSDPQGSGVAGAYATVSLAGGERRGDRARRG